MEPAAHIDAVEREVAALADALAAGPRDAPVPSCPEWSVVDLAEHLRNFTGWYTHLLCEATGRPKPPAPDPPDDGDLGEWYRTLGHHLVEELRATPPDTEVWTWKHDDHTPAFVARRAAHELSVHRVDAQLARGAHTPIDAALAVDGIDEALMLAGVGGVRGDGRTLHLHGTDRDEEWLLTLAPSGLEVERAHAKADLALRGGVSDLELVLYHRPPVSPVELLGDDGVLAAWHTAFSF